MTGEQLREKDREVLRQIAGGNNDIQKITESTTLENHEVNYCFTKLQNLGLIQVEKPGGRVTRVINGQRRNFQAPKQAELTERGSSHVEQTESRFAVDHREELVDRIRDLENRFNELEAKFEMFRKQVLKER